MGNFGGTSGTPTPPREIPGVRPPWAPGFQNQISSHSHQMITPAPQGYGPQSSLPGTPTPQGPNSINQKALDDGVGDILQASITVASLAVAFVAFLPATSLSKSVILSLAGYSMSLGFALLACGTSALVSAFACIDRIRRKAGVPMALLLTCRSYLGILFYALVLFGLIYLTVVLSYLGR